MERSQSETVDKTSPEGRLRASIRQRDQYRIAMEAATDPRRVASLGRNLDRLDAEIEHLREVVESSPTVAGDDLDWDEDSETSLFDTSSGAPVRLTPKDVPSLAARQLPDSPFSGTVEFFEPLSLPAVEQAAPPPKPTPAPPWWSNLPPRTAAAIGLALLGALWLLAKAC